MTRPPQNPAVRRIARVLALVPAVVVTGGTGVAYADAPADWPDSPNVTFFHQLLIYFVVPVALFVIISLLAYLPSTRSSGGYQPGQAWRSEPEWFGGPRTGVETLDAGTPASAQAGSDSDRGGASGRW